MGLQRRAHLRSLMNKKSGLSERTVLFSCPNGAMALYLRLPCRGAGSALAETEGLFNFAQSFVMNCNISAAGYHHIYICNIQFINISHTTKNPIQ